MFWSHFGGLKLCSIPDKTTLPHPLRRMWVSKSRPTTMPVNIRVDFDYFVGPVDRPTLVTSPAVALVPTSPTK